MRVVMPPTEKRANILGVVPFVEADVLVATRGWLRTFYGNAVEGCFKKFDVVRIGATDFNAQRHTATIGKDRPLGTQLASIRRVFPGFFPHPVATWSSPRLRFANSTGCQRVGRIPTASPSTACEIRPTRSILGSNDEACFQTRIPLAPPSIGNLCGARKRCHRRSSSSQRVAAPLGGSWDTEVTTISSAATVHQEDAKRTTSIVSPLETPPCKEKSCDQTHSLRR